MSRLPKHQIPENSSINMTPLIDVVFQLLLFFILTSSMIRPNKIELELPESTSGVRSDNPQTLEIAYRLDGGIAQITLNGERVPDLMTLATRMKALEPAAQATPEVVVRIDKLVPYQDVISVMDTVRDSGFPKFSLHTLVHSSAPVP
jgi:biopolymer transport protein ExbD